MVSLRIGPGSAEGLLQLLQHAGGTGMEDVSLAGCIWKWGRIEAFCCRSGRLFFVDPRSQLGNHES